eukprot:748015-Lingulodinium_polyedra.AAC.1
MDDPSTSGVLSLATTTCGPRARPRTTRTRGSRSKTASSASSIAAAPRGATKRCAPQPSTPNRGNGCTLAP